VTHAAAESPPCRSLRLRRSPSRGVKFNRRSHNPHKFHGHYRNRAPSTYRKQRSPLGSQNGLEQTFCGTCPKAPPPPPPPLYLLQTLRNAPRRAENRERWADGRRVDNGNPRKYGRDPYTQKAVEESMVAGKCAAEALRDKVPFDQRHDNKRQRCQSIRPVPL